MKKSPLISLAQLIFMAFLGLLQSSHAANLAFDDASSAVYADGNGWANGDNGGSGFASWSISTVGSAGVFVSSTAVSAQSFGLWANSGANSSTARRDFTGGSLLAGQTISFSIAHTPTVSTGAEVGFSLLSAGSSRITFKFVGGGTSWQMNDGNADFGAGQNYLASSPISFSFTYNGGNSYSYRLGTGSGNNYTSTSNISSLDGIVFRNNGQGNSQNLGIDDLQIVPEPSSASLLAFALSSLLALRRRRKV